MAGGVSNLKAACFAVIITVSLGFVYLLQNRALSIRPDTFVFSWCFSLGSKAREQLLDLQLDEVANLAELVVGKLLRVRDVPLLPPPGPHQRAGVAAAHGDSHVDLAPVELVERF